MKAFWTGQVPLARAFWEFAVLYLGLFNLCATFALMAALAADLPALAVVIFLLHAPCIVVAIVGVWRSAERYGGEPHWAKLARIAVVVWGLLLLAF